jgi:predicted CoA-binding protein
MSNILKNNAYQILGLDLTASEKDILKRSKEILNRLKIDDIPEYDSDIELFDNFRNEESVKEAIQKLQSAKKQIIEFFFWFYISDDIDKKALKYIKDKDFQSAIQRRYSKFF